MRDLKLMNIQMHEDLVAEIISYLPLKYLVQCKTLNKKFNHLLSDPKFVHQSHARPPKFTLLYSSYPFSKFFTKFSLNHGSSSHTKTTNDLHVEVRLLDSCNGLLLSSFKSAAPFFVFNPVTGAKQLIPYPYDTKDYIMMRGAGLVSDYPTLDRYSLVMVQELREPKGYQFHMFSSEDSAWQVSHRLTTSGLGDTNLKFAFNCRPAYLRDSLYWLMEDGRVLAFDTKKKNARILSNSLKAIRRDQGDKEILLGVYSWFGVDEEQLQLVYALMKSIVIVAYDFKINNWKVVHTVAYFCTWPFVSRGVPIWLVNKRLLFVAEEMSNKGLSDHVLYECDLQTKTYKKIQVMPTDFMDSFKSSVTFVPTLAKVGRRPFSYPVKILRIITELLDKFKLLSLDELE